MTNPEPSHVDAIADLARRAESTAVLTDTGVGVQVHRLRDDTHLHTVDLERYGDTPRRHRGTATVHDPDSFVRYVNRLSDNYTTVWADDQARKFTAVFNDAFGPDDPGWRDHTAVLALRVDPDWTAWLSAHRQLVDQATFAEFLEQVAHTVIRPDAATMLEVALTFQAKRSVDFEQGTHLQSGDVQLRYVENTGASAGRKGDLEIPADITIRCSPFIGADPVDVIARLRWRIQDGRLRIGVDLHRPDLAEREAFADVHTTIENELTNEVPILHGTAPAPITP